ncbi:hypothetical protein [Pyrobaculum calidifontis]|uniref:DUF8196 domain-containing protein n=1 Tax=Pyrobaculum calidifontis (strain DSM 21063 / JCM 11548 / VA1) TaxID=410359 RepID=A3MS61_PYRCJ|nr:hypothetical protein [Pyrobaculum calidifontis]ABO07478.1 hypothetical protein Pcal_0038 [Pyrobaculum calidifontis JCM 11548]
MEEFKRLLKRLAEEDREFLRGVLLEAIGDSGAEELVETLLRSPRARARLAAELAAMITIPLNVATKDDIKALEAKMATKEDLQRFATKEDLERFATKEDIKRLEERMATKDDLKALETRMATKEDLERFATKEDIRRLENRMATKEQFESLAISVEEMAREFVEWFLKQRGIVCSAQRLLLDEEYEFDVYCAAGDVAVLGEAKVRCGPNDVERVVARVEEAVRRWPDKFPGRVAKVLYCQLAAPKAVEKARELGVWLIETRRELTPLQL